MPMVDPAEGDLEDIVVRFAAACALYDIPLNSPEEAPLFADYGGLPGQYPEPILRAWSGRELWERKMERRIWDEQKEFIIKKILEKHSLDYYSEMRDVYERHGVELEEEIPKRIREECELAMEHSPPRHYRVEFIPGKHTDTDLSNTRRALEKQAGVSWWSGPRVLPTPLGPLLYVTLLSYYKCLQTSTNVLEYFS